MKINSHGRLAELQDYLSSIVNLNGYDKPFLDLFQACSMYGYEMLQQDEKSGIYAVMGDPNFLKLAIGSRQSEDRSNLERLEKIYGRRLLEDPEKLNSFFHMLGDEDIDGAVLFSSEGELFGVGKTLQENPDKIDYLEMDLIMRIKGKNGSPNGAKHQSALFVTSELPLDAITTSEGSRHTTIAIKDGRVMRDLVYDPNNSLFGQNLINYHQKAEVQNPSF